LDILKAELRNHLPKWERIHISLPLSEEGMSMVSWLFKEGVVHNISYGDSIDIDLEARAAVINKALSFVKGHASSL
jgi:GTP-binding protein HflX